MKRVFFSLVVLLPQVAFAQLVVTDPGNTFENFITKLQTAISNTNEASMIHNQLKNLKSLRFEVTDSLSEDLHRLFFLIGEIEGVMAELSEVDPRLLELYPEYHLGESAVTHMEFIAKTDEWIEENREAIRGAARAGAQILESAYQSESEVGALLGKSQVAAGNLQALQAGNQLSAEITAQLIKANTLFAAALQVNTAEASFKNSNRAVRQNRLKQLLRDAAQPRARAMELNIFR